MRNRGQARTEPLADTSSGVYETNSKTPIQEHRKSVRKNQQRAPITPPPEHQAKNSKEKAKTILKEKEGKCKNLQPSKLQYRNKDNRRNSNSIGNKGKEGKMKTNESRRTSTKTNAGRSTTTDPSNVGTSARMGMVGKIITTKPKTLKREHRYPHLTPNKTK